MASRAGKATANGHVRFVTRAQARRTFDRAARRYLGMSGTDFVRKWQAGGFKDPDSDPDVMHVAMLMPLGWS